MTLYQEFVSRPHDNRGFHFFDRHAGDTARDTITVANTSLCTVLIITIIIIIASTNCSRVETTYIEIIKRSTHTHDVSVKRSVISMSAVETHISVLTLTVF